MSAKALTGLDVVGDVVKATVKSNIGKLDNIVQATAKNANGVDIPSSTLVKSGRNVQVGEWTEAALKRSGIKSELNALDMETAYKNYTSGLADGATADADDFGDFLLDKKTLKYADDMQNPATADNLANRLGQTVENGGNISGELSDIATMNGKLFSKASAGEISPDVLENVLKNQKKMQTGIFKNTPSAPLAEQLSDNLDEAMDLLKKTPPDLDQARKLVVDSLDPDSLKSQLKELGDISDEAAESFSKQLKSGLSNYLGSRVSKEMLERIVDVGIVVFAAWVLIETGVLGDIAKAVGKGLEEVIGVTSDVAETAFEAAGDVAGAGFGAIWELLKWPVIIGGSICVFLIIIMMITKSSVSQFTT